MGRYLGSNSRAPCARAADVGCRQAPLLTSIRHLYSQAPLLTIDMSKGSRLRRPAGTSHTCESNSMGVPAGTSTHEPRVHRRRVPAAPLPTSNVRKSNRRRVPEAPHEHVREQQTRVPAALYVCSRASRSRADEEGRQASLRKIGRCQR
jgi:hypothetical protein